MGLLPEKNSDRVAWVQARTALWNTNFAAIGTTTLQVTDVIAKAASAATALAAQEVAQNAAKAATETVTNAMTALTNSTMVVVEQVRTKARTAGDGVYPLANIPAPTTPTPIAAPGTPYQLLVTLNPDGSIKLNWKCNNPPGATGTFYMIGRRNEGTPEFTPLGGTGTRSFTDATFAAGSSSIIYQIQAMRTTTQGLAAEFLVKFGVSSGGGMSVASVTELTTPKMAA